MKLRKFGPALLALVALAGMARLENLYPTVGNVHVQRAGSITLLDSSRGPLPSLFDGSKADPSYPSLDFSQERKLTNSRGE
jgi:hypothetical protein